MPVPALPLTCCVALGHSLPVSGAQSPYPNNETSLNSTPIALSLGKSIVGTAPPHTHTGEEWAFLMIVNPKSGWAL